MNRTKLPSNSELAWGILHVMRDIARPVSIYELNDRLAKFLRVPSSVLNIVHGGGPQFEFNYRVQWTLTNLKNLNAIYNSARGEWALTKAGRKSPIDKELCRKLVEKYGPDPFGPQPYCRPQPKSPSNERCNLLNAVRRMDPTSFEKFCHEFLRKSGMEQINITGNASNSGIEGTGVFRIDIISFRVMFRFRKSVETIGFAEIVNFRGTMVGRADKGLLIATSSFTESAQKEAVRIGAPAISLMDGTKLSDHLRKLNIEI